MNIRRYFVPVAEILHEIICAGPKMVRFIGLVNKMADVSVIMRRT